MVWTYRRNLAKLSGGRILNVLYGKLFVKVFVSIPCWEIENIRQRFIIF